MNNSGSQPSALVPHTTTGGLWHDPWPLNNMWEVAHSFGLGVCRMEVMYSVHGVVIENRAVSKGFSIAFGI